MHLNRRHAEITGIPREEMLGHSVMEFVKRGRLDVVLNPEVMRTGQPATRVQTVSDGRKLILEANPVFDAQGKLVLCITFLRDVTMLSEMREQMSVQKELLEAFQQLSTAGDAQELSRKTPKLFTSSAMIKLYGEVNTIAETDATVLLLGETGVGKDVIARRIHALSLRKNKTFIKVDCGSIPENLIETELFGYAAGTFSGASKTGKIGLIEAAAGGTLFLDEIGELPMPMQTRLLRFLQDWEIMRVGSTTPKQIDVRIVAATNKNLERAIARGEFRSDLYYRLKVAVIAIPPLRDRQAGHSAPRTHVPAVLRQQVPSTADVFRRSRIAAPRLQVAGQYPRAGKPCAGAGRDQQGQRDPGLGCPHFGRGEACRIGAQGRPRF